MNEIQVAYMAGLFEGDGSLALAGRSKNRAYIQIDMTDLDVLQKCQRYCGGIIYGPSKKNGYNKKLMYQWRLHVQAEVWVILDAIYLHLSSRRRAQIDNARRLRDAYVDSRFKDAVVA